MDDKQKKDSKIEGEGSYSGTRTTTNAPPTSSRRARSTRPPRTPSARSIRPEGAELKEAEEKGKAGDPRHMDKNRK